MGMTANGGGGGGGVSQEEEIRRALRIAHQKVLSIRQEGDKLIVEVKCEHSISSDSGSSPPSGWGGEIPM